MYLDTDVDTFRFYLNESVSRYRLGYSKSESPQIFSRYGRFLPLSVVHT